MQLGEFISVHVANQMTTQLNLLINYCARNFCQLKIFVMYAKTSSWFWPCVLKQKNSIEKLSYLCWSKQISINVLNYPERYWMWMNRWMLIYNISSCKLMPGYESSVSLFSWLNDWLDVVGPFSYRRWLFSSKYSVSIINIIMPNSKGILLLSKNDVDSLCMFCACACQKWVLDILPFYIHENSYAKSRTPFYNPNEHQCATIELTITSRRHTQTQQSQRNKDRKYTSTFLIPSFSKKTWNDWIIENCWPLCSLSSVIRFTADAHTQLYKYDKCRYTISIRCQQRYQQWPRRILFCLAAGCAMTGSTNRNLVNENQ